MYKPAYYYHISPITITIPPHYYISVLQYISFSKFSDVIFKYNAYYRFKLYIMEIYESSTYFLNVAKCTLNNQWLYTCFLQYQDSFYLCVYLKTQSKNQKRLMGFCLSTWQWEIILTNLKFPCCINVGYFHKCYVKYSPNVSGRVMTVVTMLLDSPSGTEWYCAW